jgi:uncharacterized iron-regulated membrane protein
MSSDLSTAGPAASGAPTPARARRRLRGLRRPHGRVGRWWIRLHRWASLTLGLLLLVEATSGALLLYEQEIVRGLHPERYPVTASAHPLDAIAALRLVRERRPEFGATGSQLTQDGGYLVYGPATSRESVWVDPGSGRITTLGETTPWFLGLMTNLHLCGLACPAYPGYQAWLATPLPELLGKHVTLGGYLLGVLGVLLILLCVSGAVIWWPGVRAAVSGFVVRRGRGPYVRDLDLHRVVGILALPFLLMWGFTGTMFFFDWPAKAHFLVLPGQARQDPAPPTPGTGPLITLEQARDTALAGHPGARVTGIRESTPADPDGTYYVRLADGYDPYEYSSFPGSRGVTVDSHGGGVQDYAPRGDHPVTESWFYDGLYYGLHFGTVVPWWLRSVWLLFGVAPVLLAVTGVTVWLAKRRGRRRGSGRRLNDSARRNV